jgi:GTP-binding protein YchF
MGFNCGIVGLPNVGKSTIFNAMTSAGAEAANYPFCTIEPNTGIVAVPDERLQVLSDIGKSEKIIPTAIEFVDIAGLVRGASSGEGLGNQFLGHIRSVDAIIHVVRCFEDENVTHVEGKVDPKRDVELIETELLLSDLSSIEKRLDRVAKLAKTGNKEAKEEADSLTLAKEYIDAGTLISTIKDPEIIARLKPLGLITAKPIVFVANVAESEVNEPNAYALTLKSLAEERGAGFVFLSGQVESEVSLLPESERKDFLEALDIKESGLQKLAKAGYQALNLITYFTCGPKETRAWTVNNGATAQESAGVIHSDFAKGFIRAEVIAYEDYVSAGGEAKAKELGKLRSEGKTYIVIDGDVMHFRFNV